MEIKKGTPQPLTTFSISSLGESNWCVTRPQEGDKYPSIILTSPMMGIPLCRRKSMVRVIPRADMSESPVIIPTPSREIWLSKKGKTSLPVEGDISASTIGGRRGA